MSDVRNLPPIQAPANAFRRGRTRKKPTNPQAPGRFDPTKRPSIDPTQRA